MNLSCTLVARVVFLIDWLIETLTNLSYNLPNLSICPGIPYTVDRGKRHFSFILSDLLKLRVFMHFVCILEKCAFSICLFVPDPNKKVFNLLLLVSWWECDYSINSSYSITTGWWCSSLHWLSVCLITASAPWKKKTGKALCPLCLSCMRHLT